MRRFALLVVVAIIPQIAAAQTLIADLVSRSRRALNDVRYREADSLARRVLAFGDLATRAERTAAMQVVVAAAYPEETAAQKFDTTLAYIRKLVDLGATQLPRDITHPSLDTLFALVVSRAKTAPNTSAQRQAGAPSQPGETAPSPEPAMRRSTRLGFSVTAAQIKVRNDDPVSGFGFNARMDARREARFGYRSEFSVSRGAAKDDGSGLSPFYVVLGAHVALMANSNRVYGAVGPTYALVRSGRTLVADHNVAKFGMEMTGGFWLTRSQTWGLESGFHNVFMGPGAARVVSVGLVFSP